jgi:streptogramin lyase
VLRAAARQDGLQGLAFVKVTGFISGTAPEGVVVDAAGNVFSAEVGGQSLEKFEPSHR